jgi:hypothetical protein
VDLLIQARQIHFFGLGASAPVALDAQHKFFRFNLAVTAHADVLMQRMIASVAHTGELFVIISYTGRTRELVEVARIARENGASVLGLTAENSPLAKAYLEPEYSAAGRHRHLHADDLADHPADRAGCAGHRHDPAPRRGFPAASAQDQESLNASRYPVGTSSTSTEAVRLQPQVRTFTRRRLRPPPLPLAASTQTKPRHSRPLTPINGRLPVPDHGVVAVAGVDAQLALPGRVPAAPRRAG